MPSAPVFVDPHWFQSQADSHLVHLKALSWIRQGDAPRLEYYTNDLGAPYAYGKDPWTRTYHPQPLAQVIRIIRARCAEHPLLDGVRFEACFLNYYPTERHHLGWHADDSVEMDDERPIAIASFGAARDILFRPTHDPASGDPTTEPERIRLTHGSLCIMAPGMQDTHQHCIPKSGAACGERISLTFRGFLPT